MTDRIDPKDISNELRAFTSQWRKNPQNGDGIYGLHWMAEGEEMSARITATGIDRAADAIEALVKERDHFRIGVQEMLKTIRDLGINLHEAERERDELAAVIDTAKDDLDGAWVSADGTPLGEFLLEVHRALSAAPADVLREHDAALIESLAGLAEAEFSEGSWDVVRTTPYWLRARARQVREGEA